jgi:Sugar (and other) transporter
MVFSAVAFFFIEPLDADKHPIASRLRGRRFLLLLSLSAGAVILLATALSFDIHNSHRAGTIIAFVYIFTIFYSPGAGCIPFLYSSEIWGNESRSVTPRYKDFVDFS